MDMTPALLVGAFMAGLLFGAGPCNVACMPYLGPVFCSGPDGGGGWRIVIPFTGGRLFGYAGLGAAAGMAGETLKSFSESPLAGWVLGASAMTMGAYMIIMRKKGAECSSARGPMAARNGGLFAMGLGMTLNPCAPMNSVLLTSAAMGSAAKGAALGLSFGLGAAAGPAILFGLFAAGFGRELRSHLGYMKAPFEKGLAVFMIVLGAATFAGYAAP